MTGRFITFEGVDGAGKSTHIQACVKLLQDRGITVLPTREPGGTPLAERLRELVLHEAMTEATELLLVFAARADHVQTHIMPALARGDWVVCDRFTDSTRAYQGGGRGLDAQWIETLATHVHAHCNPHRTYLFDLAPDEARARRERARAADRFESEAQAFFERVRARYLALAAREPDRFCIVDAGASVDAIRHRVLEDLTAWMSGT